MKKTLLTLAALGLMYSSAQASVVINQTNFPDEALRNYASEYDEDGNGTLSDAELATITIINAGGILNLKGAEHFKNLEELHLWGYSEEESIRAIDPSVFPKLYRFTLGDCNGVTTLDFSKNTMFETIELSHCPNVQALSLPTSVKEIQLNGTPKLTALNVSKLTNLTGLWLQHTGITDLDFSNHPAIQLVSIQGEEDAVDKMNSLNLQNCAALENVDIRYTTIKSLSMKHLPIVRTLMMLNNDITTITIDDCEEFNDITCDHNVLGTLSLTNNPELRVVNCEDNQLQVLIADNCPVLGRVQAFNNRLMWLDLKDVVKGNVDESILKLDNQQPTVQAVKLSPTEVGLRVHERLDVSRVLNLRAKGQAQTPKEVTVDGIRYFVIYDNGPDTPNLVGSDCGYEYNTKWPYTWQEGNTKDNRLPVTLNVTSWTKHQAFLTLSASRVEGRYGEPAPAAPTVTRSQDYDGRITFTSSNEKVVKVNAQTGELTVVGAGTAYISVGGTETDYRLAPATRTYTVWIDKATPTFSFEKTAVATTLGAAVQENKLSIGLYDGEVEYTSSDEQIATVGQDGVVTALAIGEVTITATGVETDNCYEAQEAQYQLTISAPSGIGTTATDTVGTDRAYDLKGRKVSLPTAHKGVYIVAGKKVVKT
ncbi:MAG: Ig-like domain-containing protein [Bacteroidaceae bacterium]|nr:Ig-like domain-containing protein [Bacteroidaceae bacterium]